MTRAPVNRKKTPVEIQRTRRVKLEENDHFDRSSRGQQPYAPNLTYKILLVRTLFLQRGLEFRLLVGIARGNPVPKKGRNNDMAEPRCAGDENYAFGSEGRTVVEESGRGWHTK
jgi:hypothetical protein